MKPPRKDGKAVEVLINGDVLFMFLLLFVFSSRGYSLLRVKLRWAGMPPAERVC